MFAEIIGSTKAEQLFLADTGANVSIMPMDLYVTIHPSYRNPLYVSDRIITAANGTETFIEIDHLMQTKAGKNELIKIKEENVKKNNAVQYVG